MRSPFRLLLALSIILGVGLRLLFFRETFSDGVVFIGTDAYYHVLRVLNILAVFPRIPTFDPWLHYPGGDTILYPGGFHYVVAIMAKLLHVANDPFAVKVLCALFPPILFVVTAAVLLYVTRKDWFFKVGRRDLKQVTAVALLAVWPAAIEPTAIGNFDHHGLESLFLFLSIGLAISLTAEQPSLGRRLGTGVLLGVMPFFWVQSPIFWAVFALFGLFRRSEGFGEALVIAGAVTLLGVFPLGDPSSLEINALSAAQPLMALAIASPFFFYSWSLKNRTAAWIGAITVLMLMVIAAFTTGVLAELRDTLLAKNPFLHLAGESKPPDLKGLAELPLRYGFLSWISIAVVVFSRKSWRARYAAPSLICLAGALAFYALQIRFETLLIPVLCVLTAEVFTKLWEIFAPSKKAMVVRLGLLLLIVPWGVFRLEAPQNPPTYRAVREACQFLNQKEAQVEKDGAVLSDWDLGHWVRYYCGRPSVLSPMTASAHAMNWNMQHSKLLYALVDESLRRALRALHVRFVMVPIIRPTFQILADDLGLKEKYLRQDNGSVTLLPAAYGTLAGRLTLTDGGNLPSWIHVIYRSATSTRVDRLQIPSVVLAQVD